MLFGHKLKIAGALFFPLLLMAAIALPLPALASHCDVDRKNYTGTEIELSIPVQDPNNPGGPPIHCLPKNSTSLNTNPIITFLRSVIQFMALGIGIVLTIGLVIGGIVYQTARANAQQVQKAEEFIRNDIIAIALFVFMFAIINFIIPGGLLN